MKWRSCNAAFCLLFFAGSRIFAGELPVEAFFKDMDFTGMEISPDGKYLVALAPFKGRANVLSIELATRKPRWLSHFVDRDVYSVQWANNERIVLQMEEDGFAMGGIFAINRDGSNERVLVDVLNGQAQGFVTELRAARVLQTLPENPESILVLTEEANKYSGTEKHGFQWPHVDRLNLMSGRATREAVNPGNIIEWIPDRRGTIRAAVSIEGARFKVLYRTGKNQDWKTVADYTVEEKGIWPLRFTGDNASLYVTAYNGKDTAGVYVFDPEQKKLIKCLWHHDEYDFDHFLLTPDESEVLGIAYDAEKPQVDWVSPAWRSRQAGIDASLTNCVNRLVSASRDGNKLVYLSYSDRDPGIYYLYDAEKKQLEFLAHRAKWAAPDQMSPMKPVSYKSRDGLTIHGYVTIPRGSAGTNLPLVVIPHGGPWVRDTWGFDPEAQFFANRGCAVLQMNFRGSTGYGFAFLKAGFRQWGLKMQDDVTDGVQWAIREGIADKTRMAIFGGSYGGFVVMNALIQTPELFRCGINCAGVTDLDSLLASAAIYSPKSVAIERIMIGDRKKDEAMLEELSPVNHADKIRAPVLLAYGGKDHIVHIAQGRRLAKALKSEGKSFEMIVEEKEGHGFHIEENRLNLYRKVDAFLKKNMN